MSDNNQIRYLVNNQIDRNKWDACIEGSPNSLIYGYSWWLDRMAKHWDALVLNDYEAVMPLTWNKKWGIKYLYQPPISPQLGIFSTKKIPPDMVSSFLSKIEHRFRFAEIFLNYANECELLEPRVNYILPLNNSYNNIKEKYKNSLIKNIKRAGKFNLQYVRSFDLKTALDLYKKTYRHTTPHVNETDYNNFEKVCRYAENNREVLLRAVTDQQQNLLAVGMLLCKRNRMYLLESTTLPQGRYLEANHFLMDNIIREFSGTENILDMDGSDIPGIAYYYSTFGCINQPYFFYQLNRLPWFIRWLK